MSAFIQWERHLSWSQATLVLLLALTILYCLVVLVYQRFK